MINNNNTTNLYGKFMDIQKYPNSPIPCAVKCNDVIASAQLNDSNEDKKGNALTKAVASIALAGGAVAILFARSNSSKFYKQINSYIQRLDDRIYDYTQKNKHLNTVQQSYVKFTQGLKKVFQWIGATNNLTAAKDVGFKALCAKLHLTKPMNWVTEQFQKITIATSRRSYENARNVADRNIAQLREIINGNTNAETKKTLTDLLNLLETQISDITNATSRLKRLRKIEANTADIGEKVAKEMQEIIKEPKIKGEKLRLYRTEVHAASGKEALEQELRNARRAFTFNISDKTKILNEACDTIGQAIKAEDGVPKGILREIRKLIKEYSNAKGITEATDRTKIIIELNNKLTILTDNINNSKYSKETQKLFKDKINELTEVIKKTENEMGTIERILITLNQPGFKENNPKLFAQAKTLTNQIRNATNSAFDSELKLYDKFAEYNVGSAPTDVVGMLIPIVLGGYAVSKGENKDEKISATLKAGIPIIGGVGTTFIAAAKMMTNMQGLLIGGATGLILNALGSKADEAYKNYQENNLYAQKAIAAYKLNNSKNSNT